MPEAAEIASDLRAADEYRSLARTGSALRPVSEPLVLVSQIERSGGTLLNRLFDGHPECHTHPRELEIGYPNNKRHWPPIDLNRPESWFEMLHEAHPGKYRRKGYWSSKRATERIPFLFSVQLQRTIFETCAASRNVASGRDVLDCYFTSYFNAWLDNHNLYTGPKKVVTGFVPRLSLDVAQVERFFEDYPDGTFISTVRNPCGWYLSFRGHRDANVDADVEGALGSGVGRPWPRSRRASVTPNASSSSCTRPSCETPRPQWGALPVGLGSPYRPRSSFPPSTEGRSLPTRVRRSTDKAFFRSARRRGERASTRPRQPE